MNTMPFEQIQWSRKTLNSSWWIILQYYVMVHFVWIFVMGRLYSVPSCFDQFISKETAPTYNLDVTPVL